MSDRDMSGESADHRQFGSDDGEDDDTGGGAFMSLLNSYYDAPPPDQAGDSGVDGYGGSIAMNGEGSPKNSQGDSGGSDNIDTVQFNADRFVKNLLTTKPMENLIKIDNDMVHEIKALDSDMQMLVYENYNKFIGATETIKRMKTNVVAMDGDMDSVRVKMESISTKSTELDTSLADKRSQVDKLVRVSRLLRRLEFLSELPERLELMINGRFYKSAVELFNKSVKILEKHSHVLSFKNILERTQVMMTDLRGKVLKTFEDPILEVNELGVNVAVLRLLEAPPALIVSKFLAAHKQRAGRIVKQFVSTLAADSACLSSVVAEDNGPESWAEAQSKRLETVRLFHQNFVLGLIEATRGVASVCKDVSSKGMKLSLRHPSEDTAAVERKGEGDGAAAVAVYEDLYAMIAIVLPDYTDSLVRALSVFFHVYEEAVRSGDSGGGRHTDVGSSVAGSALNQMGTSVREEHRQRWISFARQVITDCLYIDQEVDSMRPKEAERQLPLFDPLSMAVLHVLEQHQDCVFDKHVRGFLAAICDYVGALSDLTKISPGEADIPGQSKLSTAQADFGNTIALVRAAAETKSVSRVIPAVFSAPEDFAEDSNPIGSGSVSVEDLVAASLATSASMSADMHGGSEHSLPGSTSASSRRDVPLPITNIVNSTASAKALLTARFGQSKTITDDLVNLFFSLFHNVCDDAQSLVEISAAAKQHRQMRQQQWRWENNGESSQRAGTGDFADGVTAAHLLLWRYADAVSTALETYCGALKVAGCVSSSGNSRGQRGAATSHHGSSLDIFSEHSLALEPWSSSGKNAVAGEVEIYSEPGDGNDDDGDGGLGSDSGSDTSEHSSGSLSNSRSVRAGGARSHRRHKKAAKSNNSAFRFDSHSFVTVNCKDDSHGTISTAIVALLASKIFANVLPGMISRMENSLRAFGMSISGGGSTNNSSRIRDKVTSRVSHCSHMLLLAFIENRSADFSSGMSFALSMGRNVDKLAQETLVSPRDLSVTPGTLAVVEEMNRLVVLCSIILGEMPSFNAPQPMRSLNSDRRAAGGLGGVGGVSGSNINGGLGQGQYHLQLQLDIERMFSRRIPVFCPDNVSLSIDALIGAILKAAFKACEQTSRTFCLSNLSSVQLSMDAIFLKQVCVCFLKDSQDDVESIAEQVIQAITDANGSDEIPSQDTYIAIPKAVADGIYAASLSCLLLKK